MCHKQAQYVHRMNEFACRYFPLQYLITSNATVIQHNKNADYKWPISTLQTFIFLILYAEGGNWLGKSPLGISLVGKKQTTRRHYSLETCRHYDIWLPLLRMDGYKDLCQSSRGKPHYPLLRNLCRSRRPCKPGAVIESFEALGCHEPCVVVA